MGRQLHDERSLISRYLADIRENRVLSRDEERQLFLEARRGEDRAMERIVCSNLSFVVRVAREYRNLGVPFEDLLNEGNLGLIEAARRFDPGKGTKFITYAIWWVRKTIIQALSEKGSVVRVPHYQTRRLREIRVAQERLRGKLGRDPTLEELSEHLAIRASALRDALRLVPEETSLDQPLGPESDSTRADLISGGGPTAEERMIERETLVEVSRAFRRLTLQQRTVLRMRLGLAGGQRATLQTVGDHLGLSRERVRQIESEARSRLLRILASRSS